MKQGFKSFYYDSGGLPDGGSVTGTGLTISWQRGALAFNASGDPSPNGAFLEDILEACLDKLKYYQRTRFACSENAQAIAHINQAVLVLEERTNRRIAEGTLGIQEGD